MIVDTDVVTLEHARQLALLERFAVDVDRRVAGAKHLLPYRRKLIVAVEEKRFHGLAVDGASADF